MESITRKELSRLYYLNREIEREKRRLQELQQSKIMGLPHVESIDDKLLTMEKEVMSAIINDRIRLSMIEYDKLNRYISTIDDCLTRQVLTARFVDGLSWSQVAYSVGGGNTADSVRMICNRFLSQK